MRWEINPQLSQPCFENRIDAHRFVEMIDKGPSFALVQFGHFWIVVAIA
jgi:hypothetical protein